MLSTIAAALVTALQAAQAAKTLYDEIKPTLTSTDQAAIDAELAKLEPQEVADEAKAEQDLDAAAKI